MSRSRFEPKIAVRGLNAMSLNLYLLMTSGQANRIRVEAAGATGVVGEMGDSVPCHRCGSCVMRTIPNGDGLSA
jgi:hypothetical protein